MRIANLIVLTGVLMLQDFPDTVWAAEPQSNRNALEQCGAYSQASMRKCLAKKSDESNAALKQAEDEAIAALSKWDEDEGFIKLAKEKLRASSKAYEQYRNAQCAFASSLGGGAAGNAPAIRHLTCLKTLDDARAKQLKSDASALLPK